MIDHLQKAKDNKNDEFYTQLEDVEKFVADTGLSKTITVEKSLVKYIEQYNKTGKI